MNNPFYIQPLGGVRAGESLSEALQEREKRQEKQDLQAFVTQAASGDPVAMREVLARNPQMALVIDQLNQREAARNQALDQKQLQMVTDAETQFDSMVMQAETPEQYKAALQWGIENPLIDVDEEDLNEPLDTAKMVSSGRLAIRNPDLLKQFAPTERKTTTIQTPTGARVVDTQSGEVVKEITDPAKKQEFELKQKERKQKIAQNKAAEEKRIKDAKIAEQDRIESRKNALTTSTRAFQLAGELANEDVISPVTGAWDRFTPTLSGENQDVINKALELKDLLTLDNLSLMSGVLTDRDIQILARAGSGLNVDEDGFLGSEKGVVNQLKKVQSMLDEKLKSAVKRGDLSQIDYEKIINPDTGTGYSSLWGD